MFISCIFFATRLYQNGVKPCIYWYGRFYIIMVNRYDQSMYLSTIRWQWMFICGILHGYNQVVYIDNIYMGHMACLRFFSMVNRYDQSVYLCIFMKVGLIDMII